MTKEFLSRPGKNPSGSKPADTLSEQRTAREKSEQQHYPPQDKRKVVREEHTNGSTPPNRQ